MLRGEVWWVDFDPVLGGEIRKTRPAVMVGNDAKCRTESASGGVADQQYGVVVSQ